MRKQRSCLEKEITQGTLPGARRRGRPRTAWMDNKVFTKENLNDIPEAKCVLSDKEGTGLCDISFDKGTVRKSLEKLRDDKAAYSSRFDT